MPFKVYIYCTEDFRTSTKDRNHKFWIGEPINGVSDGRYLGNGKIIGEFVCDEILDCRDVYIGVTCLTVEEWLKYTEGHKGLVYGWHISDLIIYDKPKDLSYFGMKRPPQSWCYTQDNM